MNHMNRHLARAEADRLAWEASEHSRRIREQDAQVAAQIAARPAARTKSTWPSAQQRVELHRFMDQAGKPGARSAFILFTD